MRLRHGIALTLLLVGAFTAPHAARAAESYDNCTGFIDSVPATISTQGTWCMRHDLATKLTSGSAIEIAANNVTIDCNDFKLGGLAAGKSSQMIGLHAEDRQNAAIRHCNIRGFVQGIALSRGAGHLVEDNRLDGNLVYGILVGGEHSLVRGNRVYDTGGELNPAIVSIGIQASADIVDNVVDGVFTVGETASVVGIQALGTGTRISGNRVGGLKLTGDRGEVDGILVQLSRNLIKGNHVIAEVPGTKGMGVSSDSSNHCVDNTIANFSHGRVVDICRDGYFGNAVL